jgi:hypothetical protein
MVAASTTVPWAACHHALTKIDQGADETSLVFGAQMLKGKSGVQPSAAQRRDLTLLNVERSLCGDAFTPVSARCLKSVKKCLRMG